MTASPNPTEKRIRLLLGIDLVCNIFFGTWALFGGTLVQWDILTVLTMITCVPLCTICVALYFFRIKSYLPSMKTFVRCMIAIPLFGICAALIDSFRYYKQFVGQYQATPELYFALVICILIPGYLFNIIYTFIFNVIVTRKLIEFSQYSISEETADH
jgi:hypothetical protein